MMKFNILVVNPKDYETQIAVYDNYKLLYMIGRRHSEEELAGFKSIYDQVGYRKNIVFKELSNNQFSLEDLKVVISRGGLIHPVKSGVYQINEPLKNDLKHSPVGEDIINIAGLVVDAIAAEVPGTLALIADPTVVDEMQEIARVTGSPEIHRKSIFHALNQKAVAKMYAETHNRKYDEINLIVAHLGNGTTVGAHRKGRVIDVNQGFAGDGPFSLVRSGTLPTGDIVEMCFSGKKTKEQVECLITHCGGLFAHLGTTSLHEIEAKLKNGDDRTKFILEAMAYQVAKTIGEMYAVLKGEVDAILITGELANLELVNKVILDHIHNFAPTYFYPGDNEIKSMADNALRVIKGEMKVSEYA
jgi:butyrate kinase